MAGQILRCSDEQPVRSPERPQLHVAVGERGEANGDVDALANEIDALVAETEVDFDLRVAVLEGEDQPRDVQDAERGGAGDADGAGWGIAAATGLVARLFDLPQDGEAVPIVAGAFLGQCHAAGSAAKQGDAERLLQLAEMPRHRRLAEAELARHRRQATALGDAHEAAHPLERDIRFIHETA